MVAAHEIGHTLGLEHSPVRHALMSPYYRRLGRSLVLSWDDVLAVQRLYGKMRVQNFHLCEDFQRPDSPACPRVGQTAAPGATRGPMTYLIRPAEPDDHLEMDFFYFFLAILGKIIAVPNPDAVPSCLHQTSN